MNLRSYQLEAVDCIDYQLERVRATLLVMPTGTGKTVTFAETLRRRAPLGRSLLIAHRIELLEQAAETIAALTGLSTGIEMAEQRIEPLFMPQVVIASVQTLARASRREKFAPDAFYTLIVDECHHSTSDSYKAIVDYFVTAKVVGVTATPDRLDKKAMGRIFDSCAYAYTIRAAIKDRWLVPIKQQRVHVESMDLSSVRTVAGDFSAEDLEKVLCDERALHEMAVPIVERAGTRPTIVFTAGVAQAHALAAVLSRYAGDGKVLALDGTSDKEDRRRGLASYKAGSVQFLVNCGLFTEGFDAPHTSCIAVARPTKSRALYVQMVGRGFRLAPNKNDALILDFTCNSGMHKLVTTLDVLDGDYSDEVKARAQSIMADGADVVTAMDAAEAAVVAEKRARILVSAQYRTEDIDPFTVLGVSDREGAGGEPMTEKQRSLLESCGLPLTVDKVQASRLIDAVMARRKLGQCTFKQARQLARFGLRPDVGFDDARRALDAIAAAKWKGAPTFIADDPKFKVTT